MADAERLICSSEALLERSRGVRFALPELGERTTGFVVRYNGRPQGYVNRCAHVPVELDWQEGDFFDLSGHQLICSTHGARYDPHSGHCVLGPCKGRSLQRLNVIERDGNIYLILES
ncbi:rieske [2Fe-2S] domain protein [mine drainage metagenome]|uniref:Rieske [2Fe-2S] domain protein n=1 Tax=mine drainage metagenome TaxID=410659 RepID=A0A1J5QL62_9ZZZZ